MVPKGVFFVCFLWIGTLSALPSHNDDGFDVQFKRNFQTAQNDAFSASDDVPLFRNKVQNPHEQETADPTARMDLIKSIDDILRSPYEGPYLGSLQPLLQRQQTFIRPTRDSLSYRGDSSPPKRITPFSDKVTDTDQFPQSNIQTKYNHNKPPTAAISSQKIPSYSNFELQRPVRTPTRDHERKPFDYSSQTFGSDSQTHFETIHDGFGTSFEPVKSQRRPSKDRHSNFERRPATRQSSSDFQRLPDSTNLFDESFRSSGDQRRQQNSRPTSDSQRYSAQEHSYSPSKKYLRNDNIRFSDPSTNPRGYSSFERPFRPSTPHLSRRHMRNRRDLHSSQESQHYDQISSGRRSNFPDFASIGGLRELQEGAEVASGSFNHNFVFPKVKIPEIKVQQPIFRENFPFRKQLVDVHRHRTTVQTPIFFNSKPVADNVLESIHARSIEKPTRPDFSKLINSKPNPYSKPNARNPIATSYATQSFSPSGRDEPINSEPILQSPKISENELIVNSNLKEPQSVFVAVSEDLSVTPDKNIDQIQDVAVPNESYQQFRPLLLSPQKIEVADTITESPENESTVIRSPESYQQLRPIQSPPVVLEKNNKIESYSNNPINYESKTFIAPGTLQANTNIIALNSIKIEDTDAIVKSLQKFESQINSDVSSNQIGREIQDNVGNNAYSQNQFITQQISNNEAGSKLVQQNEPILESEAQSNSQFRPEREIENNSFKIHETEPKLILNLKNEPQSLGGHEEKSHFAVYGSSSSTLIESKPETFKVSSINKPKQSHHNIHHHPKGNVKQFQGHNKFIEIKPEFPQHPYITQEAVPQSGFINVPRYHEYDLIPTYETEQEERGAFKPLIDFVKKFIP